MLFIKCAGLLIVVCSCAFIGFLKSRLLSERYEKLLQIYDGVNMLYECVEKGGCELSTAVKSSFCNAKFLSFENEVLFCADSGFMDRDRELINSFFSTLGSSVKKVECDKINNFKLKLEMHIQEAKNAFLQKGKIYQTFGICIGLALAVLLI